MEARTYGTILHVLPLMTAEDARANQSLYTDLWCEQLEEIGLSPIRDTAQVSFMPKGKRLSGCPLRNGECWRQHIAVKVAAAPKEG